MTHSMDYLTTLPLPVRRYLIALALLVAAGVVAGATPA